jgi:prevent-host-death family protein
MRVGIREFKSRAEELVRRVEAGEEVTITRGSQPVAVLKSPKDVGRQIRDLDAISRLAAVGLVIPPDPSARHSKLDPNWKPIRGKGKPLSRIVIDQRREGF